MLGIGKCQKGKTLLFDYLEEPKKANSLDLEGIQSICCIIVRKKMKHF